MKELVADLEEKGYFKAKAALNYHCNYEGGLVDHSLSLYALFSEMIDNYSLKLEHDSIVICSMLHDLCKVPSYMYGYSHAKQSVKKIEEFIKLTAEEKEIILYHMGMYQTKEFVEQSGWGEAEYSLNELTQAFNKELVLLFYFCDHMTAKYLEPSY